MLPYRANRLNLVEMLMVIGVLAVLISLLGPSIKSMIGKSRSLLCMGNLQQLGVASAQYSGEFSEYALSGTPGHHGSDPGNKFFNYPVPWYNWMRALVVSGIAELNLHESGSETRFYQYHTQYDETQYLMGMFRCPEFPVHPVVAAAAIYGGGYAVNASLQDPHTANKELSETRPYNGGGYFSSVLAYRMHRIANPSATLHIADARFHTNQWVVTSYPFPDAYFHHDWIDDDRMNGAHYILNPGHGAGFGKTAHRHARTDSNFLNFDGSVGSRSTLEINEMTPGTSNCIWDNK